VGKTLTVLLRGKKQKRMIRSWPLIVLFILIQDIFCFGQVSIRLFASWSPGSVSFTVTDGSYELNTFNGDPAILEKGALILISKSGSRIVVKSLNARGYICDSVFLKDMTDNGKFSVRINGQDQIRQYPGIDKHL
jgi:hypothetical protein